MELDAIYLNGLIKAIKDPDFRDQLYWEQMPKESQQLLKSFKPIADFMYDEKFSVKDKSNFKIWLEGKDVSEKAVDVVFDGQELNVTHEEWLKMFKKAIAKDKLHKTALAAVSLTDDDHELTDDEIKQIELGMFDISAGDSNSENEDNWTDLSEMSKVYDGMLDYRMTHEKMFQFYDETMDALVEDGPEIGNGGCICAAPGMGKTAFALNIFINLITHNVPCLYLSLEMDKRAILDRMASIMSLVPFRDLRNIKYSSNAQEIKFRVNKAFQKLATCPGKIYTGGTMSMHDFEKIVRKFKATLPPNTPFVVFIDLLSMIDEFIMPDNGMVLAQQIEASINKMNDMAKRLGFHYIGTVQLKRTVEQDKVRNAADLEKMKPTREAIKNSSAFVERPRWCVGLLRRRAYADMFLEPEEAETIPDEIEVTLLKMNNGKLQHRMMNFDGPTFKVSSIAGGDD